jgi:hypothetical protein
MSETIGRQYPDGPLEAPAGWALPDDWPECSLNFWPEAAGAFLASLYGDPEPEPGPPYVHTIVPPEPIGEDEDGNLIYLEPGPAFTLPGGAQ